MPNLTPTQIAAMISASVLVAAVSFWFNRPSSRAVPQVVGTIETMEPTPMPIATGSLSAETPEAASIAIAAPETMPSSGGFTRSLVVKPRSGNCWQLLENDLQTVAACLPQNEEVYRLGKTQGNFQQVRSLPRNLTGWLPQEALY